MSNKKLKEKISYYKDYFLNMAVGTLLLLIAVNVLLFEVLKELVQIIFYPTIFIMGFIDIIFIIVILGAVAEYSDKRIEGRRNEKKM